MKERDGFAAWLAASTTAAIVVAILTGGGGCELAVPDTIPPYDCVPGALGVCPSGQMCGANRKCVPPSQACGDGCQAGSVCDTSSTHCVAVADATPDVRSDREAEGTADAGSDAGEDAFAALDAQDSTTAEATEPEENVPAEAGVDVQAEAQPPSEGGVCRDLLCDCPGPSACASRVCGQANAVTPDISQANNNNGFCTKPCCTSVDCDSNAVCFASGEGGNYCVNPEWLGRDAGVGGAIGGTACRAPSDCRSGLCVSGMCADTCCSSSDHSDAGEKSLCATGTYCRFGAFPGKSFDTHYSAFCAPTTASVLGGGKCTLGDGQCQSNRCVSGLCEAVCRTTADCQVANTSCLYTAGTGTDLAAGCVGLGAGSLPQGALCTVSKQCKSYFCDPMVNKCSDVCFYDSDCTVTGWYCRPELIPIVNFLGMPTGGFNTVSVCGGM